MNGKEEAQCNPGGHNVNDTSFIPRWLICMAISWCRMLSEIYMQNWPSISSIFHVCTSTVFHEKRMFWEYSQTCLQWWNLPARKFICSNRSLQLSDWLIDCVASRLMSRLVAIWDAHVKGTEKAVCGYTCRSPIQEMTSEMNVTDTLGAISNRGETVKSNPC